MLKTISAALLAASVIAAPAFAAEAGKTATSAPVIKADQSQTKTSNTVKADAKMDARAKAMNANAAIAPEHKIVRTHRHHHKHLSANHVSAKKSLKPHQHITKRIAPVSAKRS